MSKFSEYLRQHFEAKTAGRTPPPRLDKPVVSGPHRLGDSGYSFVMKQDRDIPGSVAVIWSPQIPSPAVLQKHIAEYQAISVPVMLRVAQNMPHGGLEAWA